MNELSTPQINYHDLSSLQGLRTMGVHDQKGALKAAAQQFEATFLNMALKTMREANKELAGDEELFRSDDEQFYQGMYDEQLSTSLSQNGSLGLADLMVQQLTRNNSSAAAQKNDSGLNTHEILPIRPAEKSASPTQPQTPHSNPINGPAVKAIRDSSSGTVLLSENTKPLQHFDTPQSFVDAIWPHAQRAAMQLSVEPKVLVAQAALETGWGKSLPQSGNNCFGIKSDARWEGSSVTRKTLEVEQGIAKVRTANFRSYSNIGDSFDDYARFIAGNARYSNINANNGNSNSSGEKVTVDAQTFIDSIARSGYATDPVYAQKIMAIYQRPELQQAIDRAGDASAPVSSAVATLAMR